MSQLLALEFGPAALEKLGLVGLLLVAVYVLTRLHMKSIADKDAQIARGQEREQEYANARAEWTSTLETMAMNDKVQAEALRDLALQMRLLRERYEGHEARCTGRGTGGG